MEYGEIGVSMNMTTYCTCDVKLYGKMFENERLHKTGVTFSYLNELPYDWVDLLKEMAMNHYRSKYGKKGWKVDLIFIKNVKEVNEKYITCDDNVLGCIN